MYEIIDATLDPQNAFWKHTRKVVSQVLFVIRNRKSLIKKIGK